MEDEKLVENAQKVGSYLIEKLKGFSGIKEVRGLGLMIGLEFDQPINDIRSCFVKKTSWFLPEFREQIPFGCFLH